ncbi:hypothetical protein EV356DRAFT_508245 [Viridothelium virens]|uniref:Uncharacterized protein n=1 Tax=Viridothelium virens TaxID=1048519 RepID=A0A6A6GY98_VIRVR|nr:hypothetical protein EV356DRAFT_508245 [Viridothelium virens]
MCGQRCHRFLPTKSSSIPHGPLHDFWSWIRKQLCGTTRSSVHLQFRHMAKAVNRWCHSWFILTDGIGKEMLSQRCTAQNVCPAIVSRGSSDRHVSWIPPERLDIPLHSLQRCNLILDTVTAGLMVSRLGAEFRVREESGPTETMVHVDNRDAFGSQLRPVLQ